MKRLFFLACVFAAFLPNVSSAKMTAIRLANPEHEVLFLKGDSDNLDFQAAINVLGTEAGGYTEAGISETDAKDVWCEMRIPTGSAIFAVLCYEVGGKGFVVQSRGASMIAQGTHLARFVWEIREVMRSKARLASARR